MTTHNSLNDSLDPDQLYEPPPFPLPKNIYLGTSTWTFPDWKGVVYKKSYASEADFKKNCLREYATIPWFRTVCIDSTFYNPPNKQTLLHYANQVSSDFKWMSKIWEHITIIRFPNHKRYGRLAGQSNPNFLNVSVLEEQILRTFREPGVFEKTGPLILQFAPFSERTMSYNDFLYRLDIFLSKLSCDFKFAIEVRNKELLQPKYFSILNKHRATHCFNHWHTMPSLHTQMVAAARAGGLAAPFYAARLLTPLGLSYQTAAKQFEPYISIKRLNKQMRGDAITFLKRALATSKPAFITANNKAEGNAALTMASLGKALSSTL